MATYTVVEEHVEIWHYLYTVEAESEEQARDFHQKGKGHNFESEYMTTKDTDIYSVTLDDEPA